MRHAVALLLAASAACLPSAGVAQRSISANDRAQGEAANPQLLAEYGGAYAGSQARFVDGVGKRVAVQSGLSNATGDFRITLLNSPVENAFAIPGGYVYVTRQLLALMNSEAELAAVLGHEVGHVAARHSNKRNTRSTIGSILSAGIGAITGSDVLGRIAGTGAQLYTLGFSRTQEYQADALSVRYIAAAGYSPYGTAAMLTQLNDETTLQSRIAGRDAKATPAWASTHPNGADRIQRARALAQQTGQADQSQGQDERFLRMLDGLVYDDDPTQGTVDGRTFRHPGFRIQFTAPAGYSIANGTDAVTVAGSGGQAQFTRASATGDVAGFVQQKLQQLGARQATQAPIRTRINGADAAYLTVQASSGGRVVDATVFAFRYPDATYSFLLVTPQGAGVGPFAPMIDSFGALSASEAGQVRAKRVRIVTVGPRDTAETLAARMAYPDYRRERFETLNGIDANNPLRPGMLVKIVSRD